MKLFAIATVALIALSGLALADNEAAFTLDLSGASKDVKAYYVKCQFGRQLGAACGLVSIWQEENGVKGLQTVKSIDGIIADKSLIS